MHLMSMIRCSTTSVGSFPVNTGGFNFINYSTIPIISQPPLVVSVGVVAKESGVARVGGIGAIDTSVTGLPVLVVLS